MSNIAINGVKIIDSDDGYDIYNSIVERYKDGENIDTIIEDILNDEKNFCTDEFSDITFPILHASTLPRHRFLHRLQFNKDRSNLLRRIML